MLFNRKKMKKNSILRPGLYFLLVIVYDLFTGVDIYGQLPIVFIV